jgi:DNA-binding LytR/AlgR family response regulator
VIDGEPAARKGLREEIECIPDVEVVGEANNNQEALKEISILKPDLVLFDPETMERDGFEVLEKLNGSVSPCVVIVTACDQHAIRAFEAGAVDYLLKPVAEERLGRCLDRVRRFRRNRSAVDDREVATAHQAAGLRKIVGRIGEEYFLLDIGQVLAFQAEHELVWIITRKQRYLAAQSLRAIEQKLARLNFARIHRNSLVNLDHVAKMAPLSSHRWLLTLTNQQEFIVSKRQAYAVQNLLSW